MCVNAASKRKKRKISLHLYFFLKKNLNQIKSHELFNNFQNINLNLNKSDLKKIKNDQIL